jgi:hypothetical protein
MERITIGYIVNAYGQTLELASAKGAKLKTDNKRSAEFYASRLFVGDCTTVFESPRAAERAIKRTEKATNGTGSYLDGATFVIERLTAYVPFRITTNTDVKVVPAN